MALGGGCEFSLHADKIQAAAETYIGLVELGIGVIPGGGGTKEFALRAGDEYFDGEIEIEPLKRRFFTIGMAKVATSAFEAYDLGIMRKGIDEVSMNQSRRIADAKRSVLEMHAEGYVTACATYRCARAWPWCTRCHACRPQWHETWQLYNRT
jgi:3-hydroxyacyl-CoA dehydrogenase